MAEPTEAMDELWRTLRSDPPVEALTALVRVWRSSGIDAKEAQRRLTLFLAAVMDKGEPDEDDPVRDVLDFVTGWCSPHMRLFP